MSEDFTKAFYCLLHSKDPINGFIDYDKEIDQIYEEVKKTDVERKEDISYDPKGENTKIDIWGPENAEKVLIMIHGGYWLFGSRKKCLPVFKIANKLGYTVATVGYDYVGKTQTLTSTVNQTLEGVKFILNRFANSKKFVIGGHSVGAHLAFQAITNISDSRIKSAFLLGGIYNLDELVYTDFGKELSLSPEEAKKWNCDFSKINPPNFPILVTNCKLESPKLYEQNVDFHKKVPRIVYKEYAKEDHFSILTELWKDNGNAVYNDFYDFISKY